MTRLARPAALAAGLILAVGACGGGGSPTLSKAEFIQQADAICASATSAVEALPKFDHEPTTRELVPVVQRIVAILEPLLAKLEKLHGASADEAVLDQHLLAPNRVQNAAARAFLDEMGRAGGNQAAEQRALDTFEPKAEDPNAEANDKALGDYGFGACSKTNNP